MEHSKEPWRECGHERGGCQCRQVGSEADKVIIAVALTDKDESYTFGGLGVDQDVAKANAKRIALCINACAGLSN